MPESNLRILHLVAGELTSGASRGAYWLHRGLLSQGIHSRVLTDSKTDLDDNTVISVGISKRGKLASVLRRTIDDIPTKLYKRRERLGFSTGFFGYDFRKSPAYKEASIIHLHWVNSGFVSMRHVNTISKPIVWTFRDVWPMTGGCHYPMKCDKYRQTCGSCPQLGAHSQFDLSRLVHRSKQKNIPSALCVVGISKWLSDEARKSTIFRNHDIRTIANNIDTAEFAPVDKNMARSILGIQTKKKIILIGASTVATFYKGFDKLIKALTYLNADNYHLCFFGSLEQRSIDALGFSFNSFGFLHDQISLRLAYSCADVFVAPSLMEAFGKTLAEAMACGTPTVCFDATGPRDIVDHRENGYRAKPFDPEDLAQGIRWVCEQDGEKLAIKARRKAVESFDSAVIAKEYIALYTDILNRQSQSSTPAALD